MENVGIVWNEREVVDMEWLFYFSFGAVSYSVIMMIFDFGIFHLVSAVIWGSIMCLAWIRAARANKNTDSSGK
jgi:hypothetical protein